MIDIQEIKTQEDIDNLIILFKNDKRQFAEFLLDVLDNSEAYENDCEVDIKLMEQREITPDNDGSGITITNPKFLLMKKMIKQDEELKLMTKKIKEINMGSFEDQYSNEAIIEKFLQDV